MYFFFKYFNGRYVKIYWVSITCKKLLQVQFKTFFSNKDLCFDPGEVQYVYKITGAFQRELSPMTGGVKRWHFI